MINRLLKKVDEIGPEVILHFYDPSTGTKGVIVIDTTMPVGAAFGGTRMLPDITTEEIVLLARAMTHKFAIIGAPVGGAKFGIWADPDVSGPKREAIFEALGRVVRPFLSTQALLGVSVDIGTNLQDAATTYEAAGVSTAPGYVASVPMEVGKQLEEHVTGLGVVITAKAACEFAGIALDGATVAIEGFGKAGSGVVRYMVEEGARIVALSTIDGAIYNEKGLDIAKLLKMREEYGDKAVVSYKEAKHIDKEEIYFLPVDILAPGARLHVITRDNAHLVRAKVICGPANMPVTDEAEEILFQRGIHSVPDFIANAGGVLTVAANLAGGIAGDPLVYLKELQGSVLKSITLSILSNAGEKGVNPRRLAIEMVKEKILKARAERKKEEPLVALQKWIDDVRKRFDL